MSPTKLAALEWAISHLRTEFDGFDEFSELVELFAEETETYRLFHHADKRDLVLFMRKFAITIPTHEFDAWRMVPPQDQRAGEIRGVPNSDGILRATDGVNCYI